MNSILTKIAAVLAFIIGVAALFSGGRTLLGNIPDYNVISWLPLYNYTMGVVSVFLTSALIWSQSRFSTPAALATFSLHALVTLLLQTVYRDLVATDSMTAMTIRLTTWFAIILLMQFQIRKNKNIPAGAS